MKELTLEIAREFIEAIAFQDHDWDCGCTDETPCLIILAREYAGWERSNA